MRGAGRGRSAGLLALATSAFLLGACREPASGALAATVRPAAFVDPLDEEARPSPLAARTLLNAVERVGSRLVAVGARGHVLLSDDRGATWTQARVPVSTDLTAVAFASSERGWAVGHSGVVLATRDGGRTWSRQLDGRVLRRLLLDAYGGVARGEPAIRDQLAILAAEDADRSLFAVWFDDERSGFAVGAFNLALHTADGGETWTPWLDRVENPRGLHLYAVRRVAGVLWIAGEQGLLLRLDETSRRFRAVATPYPGTLFGLADDRGVALAFGLRGHALRADAPGASWREVPTGVGDSLTGAAALPDGRVVLVTEAGDLLVGRGGRFRRAGRGAPAAAVAAAASAPGAVVVVGSAGARTMRLEE